MNCTIILNVFYVLHGIPNLEADNQIDFMNYCILYGKWFIHQCRTNENNIFILDFIKLVKDKLKVEKTLCEITT